MPLLSSASKTPAHQSIAEISQILKGFPAITDRIDILTGKTKRVIS